MFHVISAVFFIAFTININSSLNIPLKSIELQSLDDLPDDGKKYDQMKENGTQIDKREVPSDIDDYEDMETVESRNYVYKPLYVYRRVEHSKRRITMYNSFAG